MHIESHDTDPQTAEVSNTELVIVGGGPTGLAAFAAYLDAGDKGPVVMISQDDAPPYRRPPLSRDYLRG